MRSQSFTPSTDFSIYRMRLVIFHSRKETLIDCRIGFDIVLRWSCPLWNYPMIYPTTWTKFDKCSWTIAHWWTGPLEHLFLTYTRTLNTNAQFYFESKVRFYAVFSRNCLSFHWRLFIYFTWRFVPDLDFGRLAVGFGLLTLPKMPELKNRKTDFFKPLDIDLNTIAYK